MQSDSIMDVDTGSEYNIVSRDARLEAEFLCHYR